MKKIYLTITLFLFILSNTKSQKIGFEFGVKAGGDFTLSTIQNLNIKSPLKMHGGAFLNLTFPILGLQIEGLYGVKNVNKDSIISSIYNNVELNYIKIPVLLEYNTLFGFATIQTGPQFGILLDNNTKVANNTKDLYSNYDMSWIFGLKANIPVIRLHIYARYLLGINDVNTQTKTKSDQIQFGLEYGLFGKKIGGL